MKRSGLAKLTDRLRALAGAGRTGQLDSELLRRFAADGDPEAFADMVRRHGPMVYGVCCHQLGAADADDAFQTTFLTLIRRHRDIRAGEALAGWLHQVAVRACQLARRSALRRQRHEREAAAMVASRAGAGHDPRPEIDEELSRLPAKYRAPLILCGVQGLSQEEAAAELGLEVGALRTRLCRGRAMLHSRLTRRGVAVSAAGLAAALTPEVMSAPVPPALAASTAGLALPAVLQAGIPPSVSALADALGRSLLWTKLRADAVVLLGVVGVGIGGGLVLVGTLERRSPAKPAANPALLAPELPPRPAVAPPPHPAGLPAWAVNTRPREAVGGLHLKVTTSPQRGIPLKGGGPSLPVVATVMIESVAEPIPFLLTPVIGNELSALVSTAGGEPIDLYDCSKPTLVLSEPGKPHVPLKEPFPLTLRRDAGLNFRVRCLGLPRGSGPAALDPGTYRLRFILRKDPAAPGNGPRTWSGTAASNEIVFEALSAAPDR